MADTKVRFGAHKPVAVNAKRVQSPMAVFTRGLQAPGTQWKFEFPNGYGASVIDDGYGAEQGRYELAVLIGGANGSLTYETDITDDVLGWLTEDEVAEALDRIAALPQAVA
jgi:hypothetical protein